MPVSEIDKDQRFQCRARKDQRRTIERLAQSIGEHGVVVPVLLRRSNTRFLLVAGYRRFAAIQCLGSNGNGNSLPSTSVPALVYPRTTPVKTLLALRFAENISRKSMTPIDLSYSIEKLLAQDLGPDEIVDMLHLGSRKTLQRMRGLLDAPAGVQSAVHAGWFGYNNALALMEAKDPELISRLFKRITTDHQENDRNVWTIQRIRHAITQTKPRQRRPSEAIQQLKAIGIGVRRCRRGGFSVNLKLQDLRQLASTLQRLSEQLAHLEMDTWSEA